VSLVLDAWWFTAESDFAGAILPDGCRDVIVRQGRGQPPRLISHDLNRTPSPVTLSAGTSLRAIRLRPGTRVNTGAMIRWLNHRDPHHVLENRQFEEFCQPASVATEALSCLASGAGTVAQVAAMTGTSIRTLQRTVLAATGASPHFWLALARARRAGRAIAEGLPLSEAAFNHGYADQPHLNRAVRQWFGVTPSHLRQRPELTAQLYQSGYG
jgi:AraC-like DNA-binding protein